MISAIQHIRKMRGGSQSHLMLCSDGWAYVVKFQNNPQHLRVLANEFLATGLAHAAGLTVPSTEVVDVCQWLISSTSELAVEHADRRETCKPGFQFGSRLAGGLLPGQMIDYLDEAKLADVINKKEFAGMLVLDKWTGNSDGRQAVFHKRLRDKRYTATFIDQGNCFDEQKWSFPNRALGGVYARNAVYQEVTGWDSFEPWLSRIQGMDIQTAWNIACKIPAEWIGGPIVELEMLVERLFARRKLVRDHILLFRDCGREPFPSWKDVSYGTLSSIQSQVLPWRA